MFSSKRKLSKASKIIENDVQRNGNPPIRASSGSSSPQSLKIRDVVISSPITPPSRTFRRQSADGLDSVGQAAAATPTGQVTPRQPSPQASPKAHSRTSPGRQTWAREGRRWHRQQGPLASTPELATVQSQYLLGDGPDNPLTPPQRAHLNESGGLLEPFESPSPSTRSRASTSGAGFFLLDQSSSPEWKRVYSSAPMPHEYIFPRYEEVLRVKGLKPFTRSDVSPTPSRPSSSASLTSQPSPQRARHPIEDIPSPPRVSRHSVSRASPPCPEHVAQSRPDELIAAPVRTSTKAQHPPCRGLMDVRRPMMTRGPPSRKSLHQALVEKLCAGQDYVEIARADHRVCELVRQRAIEDFTAWFEPTPIEDLLKSEPVFLEAFASPYESCGLVISCNDSTYDGQRYTRVLSIFRKIWDGMVNFGAAHFDDNSLKYHILTYIVGRHAPRKDDECFGLVGDLLRSLSVQLLADFRNELFLDNEYLNNVDVSEPFSLLWAFMTLLSAVATRRRDVADTRSAIRGHETPVSLDTRPKTRILILIDGINFLEKGTDKPCREYEEFFHELDELIIKLQEGHHMECFDALREEWEAKGLKQKGKYPKNWQQFVSDCEAETKLLRENLTIKYVFIHPQISKWKPRKFGGSVILPVSNPIWI